MSHPSMTAIVEALAPFAGGPGTPFPKPEDFHRAADALKAGPALAEYVRGLEEALKPFKKAAAIKLIGDFEDSKPIGNTDTAYYVTFGDLRRAAAALGGKP